MRLWRVRAWRDFRKRGAMLAPAPSTSSLRAEARLLTTAGVILLLLGFPLTMALALMALAPDGVSPILPAAAGGPPLLLGYLACHLASRRLERAKTMEQHLAASMRDC